MADKCRYLDLSSEEHRKPHEEFTQCQDWSEVESFLKKVENLNESQEKDEIPYYDMFVDEYCKKYGLVSLEEIMDRHAIPMPDLLENNEDELQPLYINQIK